jgi:branched-chain amino acid transport system substrate-binding protein
MKRRALSATAAAIIVIILVVAIAGGAYFYMASQPPPPAEKPPEEKPPAEKPPEEKPPTPTIKEIKIGLIEPLSGAHSIFGVEAKVGAEIAIEHINEAGGIKNLGGAKLVLVVEDSQDTVDGAKLAAQRLVAVEKVPILQGAYISRHTLAFLEVTDPAGVIAVIDGIVDYLTEQGFRYVFRVAPKQSVHAESAAEFVKDMAKRKEVDIERVVILNEDSIFGKLAAVGFQKKSLTFGWTVADHIEYPYDITDMSAIVERVKNANPDVVFSCPYFTDGVLFAKTADELGLHGKVVFIAGAGACGYVDEESIKAAGGAVEWYTNTYGYNPMTQTYWNQKFVEEFKKRMGRLPQDASGEIYYATWVIKEALEKAAEINPSDPLNPETLRQAFLSLDITSGPAAETYPSGHIKFADNGDNQYGKTIVMQVIDGKPYVVWPDEIAQREPVFPRGDWKPSE